MSIDALALCHVMLQASVVARRKIATLSTTVEHVDAEKEDSKEAMTIVSDVTCGPSRDKLVDSQQPLRSITHPKYSSGSGPDPVSSGLLAGCRAVSRVLVECFLRPNTAGFNSFSPVTVAPSAMAAAA